MISGVDEQLGQSEIESKEQVEDIDLSFLEMTCVHHEFNKVSF